MFISLTRGKTRMTNAEPTISVNSVAPPIGSTVASNIMATSRLGKTTSDRIEMLRPR